MYCTGTLKFQIQHCRKCSVRTSEVCQPRVLVECFDYGLELLEVRVVRAAGQGQDDALGRVQVGARRLHTPQRQAAVRAPAAAAGVAHHVNLRKIYSAECRLVLG